MADNCLNSTVVKLILFFRVFPTLIRQNNSILFGTQRVINICIARVSFKRTIFFIQPKALNFTCLLLRNAKILNILNHIDSKKIKKMGTLFEPSKFICKWTLIISSGAQAYGMLKEVTSFFSNNKPRPSTIDGIPSYLKLCLLLIMS